MTVTPQNPPLPSLLPSSSSSSHQHPSHQVYRSCSQGEERISEGDLHRLPTSSSGLYPSTLPHQLRSQGSNRLLHRVDSSSFSYQPPTRLSSSPRHKRRSRVLPHEGLSSTFENSYAERGRKAEKEKEEEEEQEEGVHHHHRRRHTITGLWHGGVNSDRRASVTKNAGMTRGRYSFLLHRNTSSPSPVPGDSQPSTREEEEREKKRERDGVIELHDDEEHHEDEEYRKKDRHDEDEEEEDEDEDFDEEEEEEEGSGDNLVYADEPEQEEMYNKGEAYSLSSTHNFGSFRSRDNRDIGSTSSLFTIPLPDYEIPHGAPALLNKNVVSQVRKER